MQVRVTLVGLPQLQWHQLSGHTFMEPNIEECSWCDCDPSSGCTWWSPHNEVITDHPWGDPNQRDPSWVYLNLEYPNLDYPTWGDPTKIESSGKPLWIDPSLGDSLVVINMGYQHWLKHLKWMKFRWPPFGDLIWVNLIWGGPSIWGLTKPGDDPIGLVLR